MIMNNGVGADRAFKYSELIKEFPIHGELTDKDMIQVSHHLGDDKYETCYVTLADLKKYMIKGVQVKPLVFRPRPCNI